MMNSFSVTEVKRESRMADSDKSLIVEGEASESDEDVEEQKTPTKPKIEQNNPQAPSTRFGKLSQMGHSVSSAVSSAVEKQLSAYLPGSKDDSAFSNLDGSSHRVGDQTTVPGRFLTKASSLAAEILPAHLQPSEQVPPKSLLHEKLFEKNASMARNFSNWVDEHYNQKIPKVLEEMLHHLGTTTQVEFQESALSMQQANQTSLDLLSALEETKLLSDSLVFPSA